MFQADSGVRQRDRARGIAGQAGAGKPREIQRTLGTVSSTLAAAEYRLRQGGVGILARLGNQVVAVDGLDAGGSDLSTVGMYVIAVAA